MFENTYGGCTNLADAAIFSSYAASNLSLTLYATEPTALCCYTNMPLPASICLNSVFCIFVL